MSEETKIEWVRSTFNTHIGCTRVSPGCDSCYAAVSSPARVMGIRWGPGQPRRRTSPSNWDRVRTWNRKASASGEFWSVFSNSLSDVFDCEVPLEWRTDFWNLVRDCPSLTFLVLTKRVGNMRDMLPPDWGRGYPNVWLGITVVNQAEADRDIPKLMLVPARVRWLSMEPLLGRVDLRGHLWKDPTGRIAQQDDFPPCIDWVIVGGESGANSRPLYPDWVRFIRDQCAAAGVAFHFKQWGEFATHDQSGQSLNDCYEKSKIGGWVEPDGSFSTCTDATPSVDAVHVFKLGKRNSGRLLDGMMHDGYPALSAGPAP